MEFQVVDEVAESETTPSASLFCVKGMSFTSSCELHVSTSSWLASLALCFAQCFGREPVVRYEFALSLIYNI